MAFMNSGIFLLYRMLHHFFLNIYFFVKMVV